MRNTFHLASCRRSELRRVGLEVAGGVALVCLGDPEVSGASAVCILAVCRRSVYEGCQMAG